MGSAAPVGGDGGAGRGLRVDVAVAAGGGGGRRQRGGDYLSMSCVEVRVLVHKYILTFVIHLYIGIHSTKKVEYPCALIGTYLVSSRSVDGEKVKPK